MKEKPCKSSDSCTQPLNVPLSLKMNRFFTVWNVWVISTFNISYHFSLGFFWPIISFLLLKNLIHLISFCCAPPIPPFPWHLSKFCLSLLIYSHLCQDLLNLCFVLPFISRHFILLRQLNTLTILQIRLLHYCQQISNLD